jgi:hypothetical protein
MMPDGLASCSHGAAIHRQAPAGGSFPDREIIITNYLVNIFFETAADENSH